MTAPLLSAAQLTSIQALGESGMTTTVEIYPSVYDTGLDLNDDPYGSSLEFATTASDTVKGWLVGTWALQRDAQLGDVNSTTLYHLRLPVGTSIQPGWLVKVEGREYLVEDSGTDQTWPEWLTCTLKRKK